MKKTLLTTLAFFVSLNFMLASSGIFETYIFLTVNGSQVGYRGSSGGGTALNGTGLGSVSSLVLRGGEVKTFKNGGSDVTGASMSYRIYKQGDSPGGFSTLTIPFGTELGGGNQSWFTNSQTINLFSSVTSNGTWVIEVFWNATTNIDGTHVDNCGGGNCIATFSVTTLSAELSDFSAQKSNHSIALSWLTAAEQNNNHFNIERSSNGKFFTTIGQVKGSGTTASSNKYTFTDNNPFSGVNYYRLNAVETTGKTALSKVVTVDFSAKGNQKLLLYPNPTKSALNFNYESNEDATLNIQVLDMTGKVHLSKQMDGLKGDNNMRLDIENLPNGAYFMRINDSTTKFFKMY